MMTVKNRIAFGIFAILLILTGISFIAFMSAVAVQAGSSAVIVAEMKEDGYPNSTDYTDIANPEPELKEAIETKEAARMPTYILAGTSAGLGFLTMLPLHWIVRSETED